MKNATVREDVREIKENVVGLTTTVSGLTTTVSGLVTTVNGLVTAVGGLTSAVGTLSTRVGGLETKVEGLDTRVGGLETKVGSLDTKFGNLEVRFDGLEQITKQNTETIDVLAIRMLNMDETMTHMREEMMTKKDKDEIISAVDKLTQKHLKLDQEQTMMSHRLQEHDKQIAQLQLAVA